MSILESTNLRGADQKARTRHVELPELKSFLDLEDKVLMDKLTKQFLEDCGNALGDGRLKHMFAMVHRGENGRSLEPSFDSQAILFKSQ